MNAKLSVALLVLGALLVAVEAKPAKRSVVVASPLVATVPVVAASPVVSSAVVHANPTTVVKTEQVHNGHNGQSSYSYTSEVKAAPVVHTAVASPALAYSTVHSYPSYAAYPATSYSYSYAYPHTYSYAYSPYSYVLGK